MRIPEILLVQCEHKPGSLAKVLTMLGDHGLLIEGLRPIRRAPTTTTWELTTFLDEDSEIDLAGMINELPIAKVLGKSDRVFQRHRGGKIKTVSQINITSLERLQDVYTPGVARVCLAIQEDLTKANEFTNRQNTVAIVTNGTAILGLGHIGAVAGLPVMEGKAALFAQLVGISGVPILIESTDPKLIIETVVNIAPSFGAIQLEDIGAPECFEIEDELKKRLDIPVMHDDQHGTAVVALAALLTAVGRVGKHLNDCTVGQIGLGAAGMGIAGLLNHYGAGKLIGADLNPNAMARFVSLGGQASDLKGVMAEADVVIATTGVKGLIKPEMVRDGQVILALSNPEPEISREDALANGALFAADGKGINNVLGFPGIFRGALDAKATQITRSMLVEAALALSEMAGEGELVPDPLDAKVHARVSLAAFSAVQDFD